MAGAREIANVREVTRQLRAMNEPVAEVTNAVEEVMGLRPGDRRPRWLAALMRRGGQEGASWLAVTLLSLDVQ